MRQIVRIAALLLAVLLVLPMTAGAAEPPALQPKEHWFTGDNTLYNHGLAQASMKLSADAGNGVAAAVLAEAGFSNATTYTEQTYGSMALFNYTIASATVGQQPVTVVVFEDPTAQKQLESIADFDGRHHGFTAGKNREVPVLLCSALSAMENLNPAENSCVWITGTGYGGGAAELLAALLNGKTMTLEDTDYAYTGPAVDVRAYTFGAPAVSTAASGEYENIFILTNPEDLMTYLPGTAWGYRHFGQEIRMDTFYGKSPASAAMRTAVAETYTAYTGKEYYVFSADDYKTGDTTEGIAAYICSSKLAPTVDAYYNASYPAKIASKLDATSILFESNPKTVYYTTYQLISDALSILSGSSSDEFARLAVGTYLRGSDSPYYPVISFMFEHALDLTFSLNLRELLEALPQIIALQKAVENGGKPDTFEMVCSHTPSSYLAWMMAAETPDQLSAQAVKQLQWMDVSADGSNIFCSANLSKSGTYWLAVYDKNGRMLQCLPLGSGLLAETNTVSGAGTAKLFLLNDAHAPMVGSVSSR